MKKDDINTNHSQFAGKTEVIWFVAIGIVTALVFVGLAGCMSDSKSHSVTESKSVTPFTENLLAKINSIPSSGRNYVYTSTFLPSGSADGRAFAIVLHTSTDAPLEPGPVYDFTVYSAPVYEYSSHAYSTTVARLAAAVGTLPENLYSSHGYSTTVASGEISSIDVATHLPSAWFFHIKYDAKQYGIMSEYTSDSNRGDDLFDSIVVDQLAFETSLHGNRGVWRVVTSPGKGTDY